MENRFAGALAKDMSHQVYQLPCVTGRYSKLDATFPGKDSLGPIQHSHREKPGNGVPGRLRQKRKAHRLFLPSWEEAHHKSFDKLFHHVSPGRKNALNV